MHSKKCYVDIDRIILKTIEAGDCTRKNISQVLSISLSTADYWLRKFQLEGMIYIILPAKVHKRGGSPHIFQLTERGMKYAHESRTTIREHESGFVTITIYGEDRIYKRIFKPNAKHRNKNQRAAKRRCENAGR